MIRVWYHSNCYDGFGAAWAAQKSLGTVGVDYQPCSYGFDPPEFDEGDTLYIVDFSFPRDVLLELQKKSGKIQVLDHHKTAEAALEGLDFCEFDMKRSGAGMTWDYFHPDKPRPKLINHIEDRDLWKFEIAGSKEVHAYLCANPMDFDVWDSISERIGQEIYESGALLLAAKMMEVENICKNAWVTKLDGHDVAVVNTSAHWSEVGHMLNKKFPEVDFAVSFTMFQDQTMWSLRGEGDFDVSEVAKKFGGGGHKSAAGFKTASSEGLSKIN